MADGLSFTKERVPLSALEKFPNSGRARMSYCEAAATTSTQPQPPPPPAIVKTATKQPKAIGRSNSFTFDFVRPHVFKSVGHETTEISIRNSLDERDNETEKSSLSSESTTLLESEDR